jgi:hypothetical protein
MNKLLIPVLMLLPCGVFAQQGDILEIRGYAQVEYPDSKSKQQVEGEALEMAEINALEGAFGRAVVESNSTYLKNLNTGEKVETTTVFNMMANTLVKGEVIEVIEKKFEEIPGIRIIDGKKVVVRDVKCTIRIKARELSESQPDFTAFPMGCVHIKCRTTDFKNNDPLYLYFKSPSSGYLTIFLDDGYKCQRLLPYSWMEENFGDGVPVTADKEYYLFSGDRVHTYFGDEFKADEYSMVAESLHDQNRIFLVYSSTPIPKPGLKQGVGIDDLSVAEKSCGWKVPKSIGSEDFQRWLIYNRIHNRNIRVKMIDITITK